MEKHRIYSMSFASVYPLYITKAEKKCRTKAEVDKIVRWLTGYSQKELNAQVKSQVDFETFFAEAHLLNPSDLKKCRTKAEVDKILRWLTGYSQKELNAQVKSQVDFETFFAEAPLLNPSRKLITGTVCGIRVEEIKDKLMQEIRYLDKLIDELAKGKAMGKILREE